MKRREFLKGLAAVLPLGMMAEADMMDLYMMGVLPSLKQKKPCEDCMNTERQILTNADDGYWYGSTFDATSANMLLGSLFTDHCHNFFRFENVGIPTGAVILSAILSLYSYNTLSGSLSANIYCNDADDAVAPTDATEADGLILTAHSTSWFTNDVWTQNTWNDSPDFKDAVQEVIDRPGRADDNALMVVVKENGSGGIYDVYQRDGGASYGAKLRVSWEWKWGGKINGIQPAKINGIPVENIRKWNGM